MAHLSSEIAANSASAVSNTRLNLVPCGSFDHARNSADPASPRSTIPSAACTVQKASWGRVEAALPRR